MEILNSTGNNVYLTGEIVSPLVRSENIAYEDCFDTILKVNRLSGVCDNIPITISDEIIKNNGLHVGSFIAIYGEFRSYNKIINERSKLMLSVFVKELTEPNEDNPNAIELTGYLCKAPIYRTTPFNREIADLLIAVNRAPQTSDYIPCIAWGRNARMAKSMFIGDRIFIGGRIQSREYQKRFEDGSIETRVAFEVSINQLFREEENPESMEQALSLNSMSSY